MTSPFGLGSHDDPPPPPPPLPPPRRRGPLTGALVAASLLAAVLAVVVVVRAVQREAVVRRPPSTTTTTRPAPGPSTEDGAVVGSCPAYPQNFPLPTLGCTELRPPNLGADERVPLVVLLHGFNTSPSQEIGNGDWDAAVVRRRFILAVPESNLVSWNAGGCCGLSQSLQIDDIARLRSLIEEMKRSPSVDPARVYLVGNSNGGMMVYRFLCTDADRVAGAASVEGTRVVGCTPDTPVDFLHVAGRDDMAVPFEGGQSLASWVLGVSFAPVPSSMEQFAEGQDCAPPTSTTAGRVTTQRWACARDTTVQLVSLDGWGHAWPTPDYYRATDEVLDFFGVGS